MMNNFDVAGILRIYSDKAVKVKTTEELKLLVLELRRKLDVKNLRIDNK